MPQIPPMLAATGAAPRGPRWSFEVKWDGWRALVYVDGGLTVRTRSGRNVTVGVPELAGLAEQLAGRQAILDGELVVCRNGAVDFYALGGRMAATQPLAVRAASEALPVTFVAFDVLWLDVDVTGRPLAERKELLDGLELAGPAWVTNRWYRDGGEALFAACVQHGHEGIVAKRVDGRYLPGKRSATWIKCKCPEWVRVHGPRRHTMHPGVTVATR